MLRGLRPSPAFGVAMLALFVAIGGTAYAAATINGGTITDRTIVARKMVGNTLTGAEINEATLGAVPKANQAVNASTLGLLTMRKVYYAPTSNSATPTTILHLGGLVLTATCNNGDVAVMMTSTFDHAHLASEMFNSAGTGSADGLHHSDFGPNSAIHLESLGDGNAFGETSFTYTRPGGTIVNGQLSFDSSDLSPIHPGDGDIFNHAAKCLVSGMVTSTTATP